MYANTARKHVELSPTEHDGTLDHVHVNLPDGRQVSVYGNGEVEFWVTSSDKVPATVVRFNSQA